MAQIFKNKRGQLTLFVIIAIIIVAALAVGLLYFRNYQAQQLPIEDLQGYIEKCINDGVKISETKLLQNNGYLNLSDNYLVYYGQKVPYLCKATQFYVPCINQEPMYLGHLRKELASDIEKKSGICFSDLKYLLTQKGYSVSEGNMNLSVDIQKTEVVIDINKKFDIRKDTESKNYNNFRASFSSPLYDLAITTQRIVNYESTFCEFDNVGWMLANPDSKVFRFVTSEGSKVYTVTDRVSNSSIKFAVKTCVMPAGI
jgi:hypothetical protein